VKFIHPKKQKMKKLLFVFALGAFVACKNGDKKEGTTDSPSVATPTKEQPTTAPVTEPAKTDSATTTTTAPVTEPAKTEVDTKKATEMPEKK